MTARLLALGGAAAPASLRRLIVASGRTLVALLGLYLLFAVRTDDGFTIPLLVSLALLAGLFFVSGRSGALRPLILYIMAMAAFIQLRAFADQTGIPTSYAYVADIEKTVFGAPPTVWLQDHLYKVGHASILDMYTAGIYLSYFAAFQVAALVVWFAHRRLFPLYASAVLLAEYIGLIVCLVLPTAPPWLAAENGYIAPVHRSVKEILSHAEPNAYDGGTRVVGLNDVAAMPSLHMAMSVLVMLLVWRLSRNRVLKFLSVVYAASMAFALVYLGEHYVTDEFFGVLAAVSAWCVASKVWSVEEGRFRWPILSRRRAVMRPAPASVSVAPDALSQ